MSPQTPPPELVGGVLLFRGPRAPWQRPEGTDMMISGSKVGIYEMADICTKGLSLRHISLKPVTTDECSRNGYGKFLSDRMPRSFMIPNLKREHSMKAHII